MDKTTPTSTAHEISKKYIINTKCLYYKNVFNKNVMSVMRTDGIDVEILDAETNKLYAQIPIKNIRKVKFQSYYCFIYSKFRPFTINLGNLDENNKKNEILKGFARTAVSPYLQAAHDLSQPDPVYNSIDIWRKFFDSQEIVSKSITIKQIWIVLITAASILLILKLILGF